MHGWLCLTWGMFYRHIQAQYVSVPDDSLNSPLHSRGTIELFENSNIFVDLPTTTLP